MVNQEIKKSETTLAGITFSILIAIVLFTGAFLWINDNAVESGRPIDAMYNTSYTQLQNQSAQLDRTIGDIRTNLDALKEPDNTFAVAWNGLKGLVNIFRVPLNLISIGWQTFQLMIAPLAGIIPMWIINIVALGILAFIIYVIASVFKGDSNVIR